MSELKSFFDNLNSFFKEDEEFVADIPATAHKNPDTGEIEEIRIYIPDYDQFIYIDKAGIVHLISVPEEEEKSLHSKKSIPLKKKK